MGFKGSEDLEGSDGLEHDFTRVEREGSDLGANFSITKAILDLTRLKSDGFIVVFLVTLDGVLDDAVVVGRDGDESFRVRDEVFVFEAGVGLRASEEASDVLVGIVDVDVLVRAETNDVIIVDDGGRVDVNVSREVGN